MASNGAICVFLIAHISPWCQRSQFVVFSSHETCLLEVCGLFLAGVRDLLADGFGQVALLGVLFGSESTGSLLFRELGAAEYSLHGCGEKGEGGGLV